MNIDITFHYPPELMSLLIDGIPLLNRTKKDVFLFFKGAGISDLLVASIRKEWEKNPENVSKYEIVRQVLTNLNEKGEPCLRERREVLKRVVEFESFSACWDADRLKAKGLVAEVREVVNVKDSFTRMRVEKDEEKKKRLDEQEKIVKAKQDVIAKRVKIKSELYGLFGEKDAQKRGKALEKILNNLFESHEMPVKEAFTVKGLCGEGVIEQIDGLIDLDGSIYLVEMKWWSSPIGVNEVAPHLVRIYSRGGQARGIFISYTEFTEPAISQCREAINRGAIVVLSTLQEIVSLLDSDGDLKAWLKRKVQASIAKKQPYFK